MTGLQALAAIAPTLKEAELRVLLELARRAEMADSISVRASSRELASACNASRRNVQYALDSLSKRNLIAARQGTATSSGAYRLNFLETVSMGGAATTPPPPAEGWDRNDATPALFQHQPGADTTPPPTENTALTAAAAAVSISSASLQLIDRVLSAKAKDFDPETVGTFRRWLHGYMCKLGRDERNAPFNATTPHPPSDDLVAQFLAIADPRRLGTLLDSLMLDRQTCYSYGWFVTVALQRVHGLHFAEQKKARAALAVVRRGSQPAAASADPDFTRQTEFDLASIARAKAIR